MIKLWFPHNTTHTSLFRFFLVSFKFFLLLLFFFLQPFLFSYTFKHVDPALPQLSSAYVWIRVQNTVFVKLRMQRSRHPLFLSLSLYVSRVAKYLYDFQKMFGEEKSSHFDKTEQFICITYIMYNKHFLELILSWK